MGEHSAHDRFHRVRVGGGHKKAVLAVRDGVGNTLVFRADGDAARRHRLDVDNAVSLAPAGQNEQVALRHPPQHFFVRQTARQRHALLQTQLGDPGLELRFHLADAHDGQRRIFIFIRQTRERLQRFIHTFSRFERADGNHRARPARFVFRHK